DAFVLKLNAAGTTAVYSSFLGGGDPEVGGQDDGYGIAADGSGNAYVVGMTSSGNFPTASAYDSTLSGGSDAVLTKVNASGSSKTFSTFLGGASDETAYAVAVTLDGRAVVAGTTSSSAFPTVSGAKQTSLSGASDAFVTRFAASGGSLEASTYLG